MPLNDILGHRELALRLLGELNRRPAHAYLFWGPHGIGKAIVAEGLAASRLCERHAGEDFCCNLASCPYRVEKTGGKTRAGAPAQCECCPACVQMALRIHPDFDYLARAQNRTQVLIEQARELIAHLGNKPVRGTVRVAIINDAHALNLAAQNALLKTLEEPPGHAIIFLVADSESLLLDTVRSRLRPVRFPPLPRDALVTLLCTRNNLDPARAGALARLARGSAARAMALAAGVNPPAAELLAALKQVRRMDLAAAHGLAERFFNTREEALDNFELMARLAQELLSHKLFGAEAADTPDEIAAAVAELARTLSRDNILILLDLALRGAAAVQAMANPRLQAEGLWLAAADSVRQSKGERSD